MFGPWLVHALKEPMAREREPAVRFSWEETWLSLINILHCGVFLGILFDPSVAWLHTVASAQILLISPNLRQFNMVKNIHIFYYMFLITIGHSDCSTLNNIHHVSTLENYFSRERSLSLLPVAVCLKEDGVWGKGNFGSGSLRPWGSCSWLKTQISHGCSLPWGVGPCDILNSK